MKKSIVALAALLSLSSFAADPKLTSDEEAQLCATQLPKQLACKEDFCSAMVELRVAHDPRFKSKAGDEKAKGELKAKCLEEIAVDGTGTDAERVARCKGWSKERPPMNVTKSQADAMQACWAKPVCGEAAGCFKEKLGAVMASRGK
jgi:hypothetical protein